MIETVLLRCSRKHTIVIALFDPSRIECGLLAELLPQVLVEHKVSRICLRCGQECADDTTLHFATPAQTWAEVPDLENVRGVDFSKLTVFILCKTPEGKTDTCALYILGKVAPIAKPSAN